MEEKKITACKWKPIQGYEGLYEISNTGLVRSISRNVYSGRSYGKRTIGGKILKQNTDKDGYKRICLCKNGAKNILKVHRLVAKAFICNAENLPLVNHKNKNKSDNRVENLEWCSVYYNNHYLGGYCPSRFNNVRKIITQFDINMNIIRRFDSIKEAAISVRGNRNTIAKRASMKSNKPYCGCLWAFS